MLKSNLKEYNIILASASPRRQELLKGLGIDFSIKLVPIKETYPDHLKKNEITAYLAKLKSQAFKDELKPKDVLITSDTIVWFNNKAIGKPKNEKDAFKLLSALRGQVHEVFSSVCFTTVNTQKVVSDVTKVTFKDITEDEIWYYINTFKPFDKAGSYGIQDWIGQVAVSKIEGSYFNVMGFPTHLVYWELKKIIEQ